MRMPAVDGPAPQADWYRDAVVYEVHVRAFHDSDADGIGDFRGLVQKLDYLQDLGVTALWLLPFYPSPLRDDGYDIADYRDIHPRYGTLQDFKLFLREAHGRGLRVRVGESVMRVASRVPWARYWRAIRSRSARIRANTLSLFSSGRLMRRRRTSRPTSWNGVPAAPKRSYCRRLLSSLSTA